jgi:hypothetical protein
MIIKEKEQRQELELIFFVKEKLVALRVSMQGESGDIVGNSFK